MKNIRNTLIPTLSIVLTPLVSMAQTGPNLGYVNNAVNSVGTLVGQLIPIVIAIGLLFFIWGLVQFILASGDEAAKDIGKRRMIWGVITLFVIVAVWGIVGLLGELSGVELGGTVDTPTVNLN
ncbi:MAG: hypothetical protein UV60_C0007G0007 [Parcubacteria group bacterium GW2011_GWA2_43_11]|nr:MAG: hypothetical protein UU89_C0025G0004 [Parcubacteria group bacterium GW2011_GWC2_42_11]KKS85520.1 MAG: hypothetical protein UV60_C0007G0007 [Parcubacteria group bacterium GW2011_GWA2_43_11]